MSLSDNGNRCNSTHMNFMKSNTMGNINIIIISICIHNTLIWKTGHIKCFRIVRVGGRPMQDVFHSISDEVFDVAPPNFVQKHQGMTETCLELGDRLHFQGPQRSFVLKQVPRKTISRNIWCSLTKFSTGIILGKGKTKCEPGDRD